MSSPSCDQIRAWISDWLAGDLLEVERTRVEGHLAGCPDCQRSLDSFLEQDRVLSELAAKSELGEMQAKIRARLAEVPDAVTAPAPRMTPRGIRSRFRAPAPGSWSFNARALAVGALACMVLALALGILLSLQAARRAEDGTSPRRAARRPESNRLGQEPQGQTPQGGERLGEDPRTASNRPAAGEPAAAGRPKEPTLPADKTVPAAEAPRRPVEPGKPQEPPDKAGALARPGPSPAAAPGGPRSVPTRATVAELTRVDGEVFLVEAGQRKQIGVGHSLLAGQGLETPDAKSFVEVVYPDRTRLEIAGGTAVREFRAETAKRVRVDKGTVRAEVARQPKDQPMSIQTPHAEATILGTTLRIVVEPDPQKGTRLEVEEGKVRLKDLAGKSLDVLSGHYAVAAVGVPLTAKAMGSVLVEAFEDTRTWTSRWEAIRGGHPITVTGGKLSIDVTFRPADSSATAWHTPGGLRSKKLFRLPLRVSANMEVTVADDRLSPAVLLKPLSDAVGPGNIVYGGKNTLHVCRGATAAETRLQDKVLQRVVLPSAAGRIERWEIEIGSETVAVAVDGKEVMRSFHNLDGKERYQVGFEASSRGNPGSEALVRFDNIRIQEQPK